MSKSNDLRKTYSGIFGNQVVIENRNGKSIVTIPPVKPEIIPSPKQVGVRLQFKLAARYAKDVLLDPLKLAAYLAKSRNGLSAYILALTDYLKPPVVARIDASGYKGRPGDTIGVTAIDDFGIENVSIRIIDPDGNLVEEGPCAFNLITGTYDFTATQVSIPTGVTIIAIAKDIPGHATELTITL